MWGILVAAIIYGVAIILNIGREGLQEYHEQSPWTEEEVNRIKGGAVAGWVMFIAASMVVGLLLTGYTMWQKPPEKKELLEYAGVLEEISENKNGDLILKIDEDEFVVKNKDKKFVSRDELDEKENIRIFADEKDRVYEVEEVSAGTKILEHEAVASEENHMRYLWMQIAYGMFTVSGLSIVVLLLAKVNPKVYKLICLMKGEWGLKPTVSQQIEYKMEKMLKNNVYSKKTEKTISYYGKIRNNLEKNEDE